MKKALTLLLAGVVGASAMVAPASASFIQEEAYYEIAFSVNKAATAWAPDGTYTPGEYFDIAVDESWRSSACADDANDQTAFGLDYKLALSWDENYFYTYIQFTDPNGHDNTYGADAGNMWQAGAIQLGFADDDQMGESRLEYGVGLTSDTNELVSTVWADYLASGIAPVANEDYIVTVDGDLVTYEVRTPFSTFTTKEAKEGEIVSAAYVISWGNGTDYCHTQLAEGITGNGKDAGAFAMITLAGVGEVSAAAPAAAAPAASAAAPAVDWQWTLDENYIILDDWADTSHAFGDAYPGSTGWDWPEVTSGSLLKGTVIAGFNGSSHCWSNGSDNAANAFDGDNETFFDPYDATSASWAGLLLDQPYELTEIRIAPRSTFTTRLPGAAIQGSNDGVNWTDIIFIDKAATGLTDAPNGVDYHCFTPTTNDTYVAANTDFGAAEPDFSVYWVGSGAYAAYRYVNINGEHGDVGEIELYGVPAGAAAAAEAPAAEAAAPAAAREESEPTLDVAKVTAPLTVDGNIDEGYTKLHNFYQVDGFKLDNDPDKSIEGSAYAAWDDDNFYLLLEVVTPKQEGNYSYDVGNIGKGPCGYAAILGKADGTHTDDQRFEIGHGISAEGDQVWKISSPSDIADNYSQQLWYEDAPWAYYTKRDEATKTNFYEFAIPWDFIDRTGLISYEEGSQILLTYAANIHTLDEYNAGQSHILEFGGGIWAGAYTDGGTVTLVGAPAPEPEPVVEEPAPVEESAPAPVEEAPAEEPAAEEVVEAPAEEVVEAAEEPAEVVEVVEEAPETFDFGVIAAISALVSLAGFTLTKKR